MPRSSKGDVRAQRRRYRERYPDRFDDAARETARAKALERACERHGITTAEYERLLGEQNERCAICQQQPSDERRLAIDHDHTTGAVRGLLCIRCNTAIGSMRDDPALLQAAVAYLSTRQGALTSLSEKT